MLAPNTVLQNRYRILRLLGQGGMGAVYQAQDLRLNQVVALKENVGGDARQFQQEAVLLANLDHPNLPRVIDHWIEPNGAQYLVMDFVEGEDLQSRLDRQGALPEAQALAWFDQILDAVAYLHGRGVIHRDIKPANIKLTPEGKAVLVDFGIAKVFQPGQSTLIGAKAATPGFAAPEQYSGGTDARSDIYALGATLYALVTGRVPPDALALASGVASLTPPRRLNPALTPRVEAAILRAVVVQPNRRWQSVGEFRTALNPPRVMLSTAPVRPTAPQTVSVPPPASVAPAPAPPFVALPPWIWAVGGAGAMLVLGVMLLGLVSLFGGSGHLATPTPAQIAQATATVLMLIDTLAPSVTNTIPPTPTNTAVPTNTPTPVTPTPVTPTRTLTQTQRPITPAPRAGTERVFGGAPMVFVPAGDFLMGSTDTQVNDAITQWKKDCSGCDTIWINSEKPQHTVYLDAFWMDKYEVTNGLFQQFVNAAGYKTDAEKEGWAYGTTGDKVNGAYWRAPRGPNSSIADKMNHPVVQVSWNDAKAYCEWAGKHLPTEAQWEKAARGTDGRIYPWGNTFDKNLLNSGDGGPGDTTAVGSYPTSASPYSIMDMAGNVWEWVGDWYDIAYYANSPRNNPTGPSSGQYKVLRGGAWDCGQSLVRAAGRVSFYPDSRDGTDGFRCAQ